MSYDIQPSINQGLRLFSPEPKNSIGASVGSFFGGVASSFVPGLSGVSGIDTQFMSLLQEQIAAQKQMQLVSMSSNIEKSKHETSMAPIRNTRVS